MFERLAMSCPMSDQLRYLDLPGVFVAVATQFVGNFKYLNWSQLKQATAVHKESCGRGFYSDKHSCSNGTRVAKPVGNGNTPSLSSCGPSGAKEERSGGNGLGVLPFVGSLTVPHGGIPFQSILLRCRFQNTFRRKLVFLFTAGSKYRILADATMSVCDSSVTSDVVQTSRAERKQP